MTDLPELELTNVGARNWTYILCKSSMHTLTVDPPRQPLDCGILETNFNYTKWEGAYLLSVSEVSKYVPVTTLIRRFPI